MKNDFVDLAMIVFMVVLIIVAILMIVSCIINANISSADYSFCVEQGYTGIMEVDRTTYCYRSDGVELINIEELRKK